MTDSVFDWRIITCPSCGKSGEAPFFVRFWFDKRGMIDIKYNCPSCNTEWFGNRIIKWNNHE